MRSSAHSVVTVTTPLSVLPYRPSHWWPTCAVFVPSLRSPLSSITSTPPPCGAVAGSARSSSSRREFTWSASQRDSERKNCSRCTAGCCAPVTGSAPASAVSVLFRSRGASSPARYSRNPRRCASELNRSSNRAAYSSSGPGAAGHGTRRVITHPRCVAHHHCRAYPATSRVNKLPVVVEPLDQALGFRVGGPAHIPPARQRAAERLALGREPVRVPADRAFPVPHQQPRHRPQRR